MTNKHSEKYPLLLRVLHWAMALLIFGNLALGFYMTPFREDVPDWYDLYFFHKSFGVLVFLLVVTRLVTRLNSTLPELPETLPAMDKKLARLGHFAFYLLMVLVPLWGYGVSSTFEYSGGVHFFGLFDLPELLPKSEAWFNTFDRLHAILAYTLLGLVGLHVAGVIKHRFFDKNKSNDVLPRML